MSNKYIIRKKGFAVSSTHEPDGTPIGEQIRKVINDLKNLEIHPRTETLFYQAARPNRGTGYQAAAGKLDTSEENTNPSF